MIYSTYDQKGRFRWKSRQPEPPQEVPTGYGFIEGEYGAEYYFDGTGAALKTAGSASVDKTSVAADGVEVVTISGIVAPAFVEVKGNSRAETDESVVELTFDTPGTYTVTVDQVPHFLQEFTINAT